MSHVHNCFRPVLWLFLMCLISMMALSCTKKYVGMTANTDDERYWCLIDDFPVSCGSQDQWFRWQFTLEKGSEPNQYIFKGIANGSEGSAKSIGRLVPSKSTFRLLLASDNVVVDSILFSMPAQDVVSDMRFKRTFKCEHQFDAAMITWQAYVRG